MYYVSRLFSEAPKLRCGQSKSICATLNVFKSQLHLFPSHLTNMNLIVQLNHFYENLIISPLSCSPDAVNLLSLADCLKEPPLLNDAAFTACPSASSTGW